MKKETIKARLYDGKFKEVTDTKRKIKLKSGEVIDVIVDKRKDNLWHVSHIESGLELVPPKYYCYPCMIFAPFECDLVPSTAKDALEIVRYSFDMRYETQNLTFAQIYARRREQIERAQL